MQSNVTVPASGSKFKLWLILVVFVVVVFGGVGYGYYTWQKFNEPPPSLETKDGTGLQGLMTIKEGDVKGFAKLEESDVTKCKGSVFNMEGDETDYLYAVEEATFKDFYDSIAIKGNVGRTFLFIFYSPGEEVGDTKYDKGFYLFPTDGTNYSASHVKLGELANFKIPAYRSVILLHDGTIGTCATSGKAVQAYYDSIGASMDEEGLFITFMKASLKPLPEGWVLVPFGWNLKNVEVLKEKLSDHVSSIWFKAGSGEDIKVKGKGLNGGLLEDAVNSSKTRSVWMNMKDVTDVLGVIKGQEGHEGEGEGEPVKDTVAPEVLSVGSSMISLVKISFNESVDISKAPIDGLFSLKNKGTGKFVSLLKMSLSDSKLAKDSIVDLEVLGMAPNEPHVISITSSLVDLAGNAIVPIDKEFNSASGIADKDPPKLEKVTYGKSAVSLEFNEIVKGVKVNEICEVASLESAFCLAGVENVEFDIPVMNEYNGEIYGVPLKKELGAGFYSISFTDVIDAVGNVAKDIGKIFEVGAVVKKKKGELCKIGADCEGVLGCVESEKESFCWEANTEEAACLACGDDSAKCEVVDLGKDPVQVLCDPGLVKVCESDADCSGGKKCLDIPEEYQGAIGAAKACVVPEGGDCGISLDCSPGLVCAKDTKAQTAKCLESACDLCAGDKCTSSTSAGFESVTCETEVCADGVDNDSDGKVDCTDTDCSGKTNLDKFVCCNDGTEAGLSCGEGFYCDTEVNGKSWRCIESADF